MEFRQATAEPSSQIVFTRGGNGFTGIVSVGPSRFQACDDVLARRNWLRLLAHLFRVSLILKINPTLNPEPGKWESRSRPMLPRHEAGHNAAGHSPGAISIPPS